MKNQVDYKTLGEFVDYDDLYHWFFVENVPR